MLRIALLTLCCVAMVMSMGDSVRDKRLVLHSDEDVATAIQTMASELHSFNVTVHSLMDTVKSLQDRLQAKQNTVHALNTTTQFLQTEAQTRDNTIQFLQSTVQSMQANIQTRDATIQSLQSKVQSLETTMQPAQTSSTDIQSLQNKVQSLQTTLQSVQSTGQTRDTAIHSLQTTLQSVQTTGQTRDTAIQSLQTTLQSVQATGQTRDTAIQSLQTTAQSLQSKVQSADTTLNSLQTTVESTKLGQGSTYVRWGRTSCQGNGTTLVYKGFTGGSNYADEGGAADYICLAQDPLWGYYTDGSTNPARVYGAEYQIPGAQSENMFGQDLMDHDAPCALCRAPRATSIMIPGRNECYPGWTLEYSGYLVSSYYTRTTASNYACLDTRPEVILGDSPSTDGKLMYVVEAICGTLPCPPYVNYREITCVVCSL